MPRLIPTDPARLTRIRRRVHRFVRQGLSPDDARTLAGAEEGMRDLRRTFFARALIRKGVHPDTAESSALDYAALDDPDPTGPPAKS